MNRKRKKTATTCGILILVVVLTLSLYFFACGGEEKESVHVPQGYYKIAILGDSITDKGVYSEIITTHYTDYLYQNCPFIDSVQNVGYAGSCIAGAPDKVGTMSPSFNARYKQIKNDVDVIIVFGGTNDYGIGSSTLPNPLGKMGDGGLETFYGGLKLLTEGITENYPNARLIYVTPIYRREQENLGFPNKNVYGNIIDEYVKAIVETCAAYNLDCIDAFHGLSEINADTYETYEIDGLHLNDAGNVLLGEYLTNALSELLD